MCAVVTVETFCTSSKYFVLVQKTNCTKDEIELQQLQQKKKMIETIKIDTNLGQLLIKGTLRIF